MIERAKRFFDEINFDFVGYRKYASAFSIITSILSVILFITPGPNWGIDFTGGTQVELEFADHIEIDEVRKSLESIDIPGDAIQAVGGTDKNVFKIRVQDAEFGVKGLEEQLNKALVASFGDKWIADLKFSAEVGARFTVKYTGDRVSPETVAKALADLPGAKVEQGREDDEVVVKLPGLATQIQKEIGSAMGSHQFEVLTVESVGPAVGSSLRTAGFMSLALSILFIAIYTAFRFEAAYAPGAIIALLHDITLTIGFMVITGREFNLATIGALLTIIGYSMNDTVVVFDRIRETRPKFRHEDLPLAINKALNDTLSRTIGTSVATLMAITVFLFEGTQVIKDFNAAMFFGIIVGTYSSLYVATPLLIEFEKIMPYLQRLIALTPEGSPEATPDNDVSEAFLSESEKRRRERDARAREAASDSNV